MTAHHIYLTTGIMSSDQIFASLIMAHARPDVDDLSKVDFTDYQALLTYGAPGSRQIAILDDAALKMPPGSSR